MRYEPVIGLEVHAQLLTQSKMFCRCSAQYAGAEPNTHICPVCAGFPGTLPVLNENAVELALRVGLALNCEIMTSNRFDRKHYPYPDLPKGYQISQYDLPLLRGGSVTIVGEDDQPRTIGLTRIHMEEDTGKSLHRRSPSGEVYSLIDLNRSGVPLLEIVSQPDMRSAAEARLYVTKLRQILRYIDACSGNMEEGALRVDVNISVRPEGSEQYGTKIEIKNLNSFRSVERALDYEIDRQIRVLEAGETIPQQTRGWDEVSGETVMQRVKEYADDYRYFPEPDLPPLSISIDRIEQARANLAELPDARRERFVEQYALPVYDAALLTGSRETADYYEEVVSSLSDGAPPKLAANWIIGDLFRLLKGTSLSPSDTKVSPALMAELVGLVHSGEVNQGSARVLLEDVYNTGRSPAELASEKGLRQVSDEGALGDVVVEVISGNPAAVEDYRSGKKQAIGFLIGQVMKQTRGTAKADTVRTLIQRKLADVE